MITISSSEPRAPKPADPEHRGGVRGRSGLDLALAAEHARAMFACLGITCEDEHTIATPERFVSAMAELTAGSHRDPLRLLDATSPPGLAEPGMIVAAGVRFVSLCRRHLLPWPGTATVAYVPAPGARTVGVSELARLVREYAARPQIQERLGQQIAHALDAKLSTIGAACLIRASHSCMSLHGVHAEGSHMATSHLLGVFRDDPAARAELLSLAAAGRLDHDW